MVAVVVATHYSPRTQRNTRFGGEKRLISEERVSRKPMIGSEDGWLEGVCGRDGDGEMHKRKEGSALHAMPPPYTRSS